MTVKSGGEKYVLVGPEQQIDCAPYEVSAPIEDDDEDEDWREAGAEYDDDNGGIYDDEDDDGRTRIGNTPPSATTQPNLF